MNLKEIYWNIRMHCSPTYWRCKIECKTKYTDKVNNTIEEGLIGASAVKQYAREKWLLRNGKSPLRKRMDKSMVKGLKNLQKESDLENLQWRTPTFINYIPAKKYFRVYEFNE